MNVLVADDDPSNLEVAAVILESLGHRVTTAQDGREVLSLCLDQGKSFDLLILDMVMPVVDGMTVTATLREHPATREMVIICTSASASTAARDAGLLVGCDCYLIKPFKRADLVLAITESLERRAD